MIPPVNPNLVPLVVAVFVQIIIGFLWYSPMLFMNQWLKLSGKKLSDLQKGKADMPKTYFWMILGTIVLTYGLAHVLSYAGAKNLMDGLVVGFMTWLTFIATTSANSVLFEGKPFKLYLLNNGHVLAGILAASAILVSVR